MCAFPEDNNLEIHLPVYLYSNVTVSQCTNELNKIYTNKKGLFPVPIVMTLKTLSSVCSGLLHQISPKLDNKCGKYRYKFIYGPM
jgi:hypothetical protein